VSGRICADQLDSIVRAMDQPTGRLNTYFVSGHRPARQVALSGRVVTIIRPATAIHPACFGLNDTPVARAGGVRSRRAGGDGTAAGASGW
jgi:hypothetical protein